MKIKTKNLKTIHVMQDGSISLGYTERHKISGKDVTWNEFIGAIEAPFKATVMYGKNFQYNSIYISDRLAPLINDIQSIEIWPENASKDCFYSLSSVVIMLKNKACISVGEYTMETGKVIRSIDAAIVK